MIRVIKSRKMVGWACSIYGGEERIRGAYKVLVGKPEERNH
jgi:hypothetical protein